MMLDTDDDDDGDYLFIYLFIGYNCPASLMKLCEEMRHAMDHSEVAAKYSLFVPSMKRLLCG